MAGLAVSGFLGESELVYLQLLAFIVTAAHVHYGACVVGFRFILKPTWINFHFLGPSTLFPFQNQCFQPRLFEKTTTQRTPRVRTDLSKKSPSSN